MDWWLRRPIWMCRYWLSSWAISFALWIIPNRAYATDLRARIHEFRDDAALRVITAREMARVAAETETRG